MKHTKRFMSIILSIVMLMSITAGLDFSAYANQNSVQKVNELKDVSEEFGWGSLFELNVTMGGIYKFFCTNEEMAGSCSVYTMKKCSDENGEWYESTEINAFANNYNYDTSSLDCYYNFDSNMTYYINLSDDTDMYFCQIPSITSSQLEFVSSKFDNEYAFVPDATGYYCFNYLSDDDKMINCGSDVGVITDEDVKCQGNNGKTIAKLTKGNPYIIRFHNNYADFETETECLYKLTYEKLPNVLSVKVIKSPYGENEPLIQDVSTSGGSDNGHHWSNYEYNDRFYLEVKFDNGKTVVTHNSDGLFGYEIECDDDQKTNWQAGKHSATISVGDKSDTLDLNMVSKEDFVKDNSVSLGENKVELLNIGKPNASYSKKRVAFKPTESGTYCFSTKSYAEFSVYDTDWDNTDSYNGNVVSRLEKDKIYVIELDNYYYDNPVNSVVLNIEKVADVKSIEVLNAKNDDNYFIGQFYLTDDLQLKVTYDNDKNEIIKLGECEKAYSRLAEPTYYYKNLYISCFSAINHYGAIDISCNTVKTSFDVKAKKHIVSAELIKQPYDNNFSGGSMKLYFSDSTEMLFEKAEFLCEYNAALELGGDTVLKSNDGTMLICYIDEISKEDGTYELKFHSFPNEVVVDTSFEFTIDETKCFHKWNNGAVTKKATCTANGIKTYTCTVCCETKTETTPKTAHIYKTTTSKATTKKNGSVVTKCSVCGTVKSKTTIYYPKTITLSTTSYTYNGKVKKPSVTVKDSKGKKISSKYYTVSYSKGRKNVGQYTVTVKFKGNYSGTVKKTFTIKPKATTISKVTASKKAFTVKWKKQSTQTTGYQIQYSTSSKFKGAKTVTVSKNKTTSKKISKLKAKKKYYVRVRTYKTVKVNGKNTKIYSSWSKAKTVKTK